MLGSDIRLGYRRLRSRPVSTAVLIAIIAVGIGASAAVFSLVDQTLLRPAPFLFPNRLVMVLDTDRAKAGGGGSSLTPAKIAGWQRQPAVFERFEGVAPVQFDLTHDGPPERVWALYVTPGIFSMLGVSPSLGRPFLPGEGQPGSARVALISDALWRRRFGAQADALGRPLTLNGEDYTVVGVLPRRSHLLGDVMDVWVPFDAAAHLADASMDDFYGFARLARGLRIPAAQHAADGIADRLQRESPLPESWDLSLRPMEIAWVRPASRAALYVLLGAVGFVLLITCANVASLFAAQAPQRTREMAIASALGSNRVRLVRGVLVESVLIAGAGGALGILLGRWALAAILALAPKELVWGSALTIQIDVRVVAVALAATLLTGVAIGLLPAWRGTRQAIDSCLRGGSRSAAAPFGRASALLIVIEVAFSLVLLTGAALMARTLVNLNAIDPGFDPEGLISMHVDLPSDRYPSVQARAAFFDDVAARLSHVPGVLDSAVSQGLPPGHGGFSWGVLQAEGHAPESAQVMFPFNVVSPTFFRTLRMPLVAGRTFQAAEQPDVAIVSQGMAARLWPSDSAVGRRFRVGTGPWTTVVGVVGNVESRAAGETRTPLQVYRPFARERASSGVPRTTTASSRTYAYRVLVVRAADPMSALPAIRQAIWSVDGDQPIEDVALATDVYADAFGRQRFVLLLMTAFSAIALALVIAGLIGVLSQVVARRTREIGIRVALGAAPAHVRRLVMAQGMSMVAIGACVGLAAALVLTRTLQTLLFEVGPADPVTFAGVTAGMSAVAVAGCWLPVRAALRIPPAEALRNE
ncbi:MAG TPA: ABC transporter permease [Vicinamibacterales bacterium]|jgi:predicted permease|nr:ABC transporter permease [Vicinamibacterales bacterium]